MRVSFKCLKIGVMIPPNILCCVVLCVCVFVDDLGELLLGECKLQTYLKENPIKQGSSPRGPRPKLVEVRKHLTAALDRGNLKVAVAGETADKLTD